MAKYLIHTCKEREWYVDNFLIPSMVKQGIDNNNIYKYIDNNKEGNLIACMKAFLQVELFSDFDEIVWHLQDDVAISKEFKRYTEVNYETDIVCAFCTREQIARPIGQVDPVDMWYSFQCIGIKSYITSGCVNWFYTNGMFDKNIIPYFEKGLGDDEVFKYYCTEVCSGLKVLNLIPNLVEHIDFLIGGSTAAKGMPQRRAMYLKDGTEIVQNLMEELKQHEDQKDRN